MQTLAPIRIIAQNPNKPKIVISAISPEFNVATELFGSVDEDDGLPDGEMLVVGDMDIDGVAVGNMDASATGTTLGTDDGDDDEEDGEDETEGELVSVELGNEDGSDDDESDGEDEGKSLITEGLDDAEILGAPDGDKEAPAEGVIDSVSVGMLVDGVDEGDLSLIHI